MSFAIGQLVEVNDPKHRDWHETLGRILAKMPPTAETPTAYIVRLPRWDRIVAVENLRPVNQLEIDA